MKIKDVVRLLKAEILCGEDHLDTDIHTACGSDMMSIVFVRGKRPESEVVELARQKGIVLLSTEERLFTACGILYTNGLGGGE